MNLKFTLRNADDLSAGLFKVQDLNNSLVHTFNHSSSVKEVVLNLSFIHTGMDHC